MSPGQDRFVRAVQTGGNTGRVTRRKNCAPGPGGVIEVGGIGARAAEVLT